MFNLVGILSLPYPIVSCPHLFLFCFLWNNAPSPSQKYLTLNLIFHTLKKMYLKLAGLSTCQEEEHNWPTSHLMSLAVVNYQDIYQPQELLKQWKVLWKQFSTYTCIMVLNSIQIYKQSFISDLFKHDFLILFVYPCSICPYKYGKWNTTFEISNMSFLPNFGLIFCGSRLIWKPIILGVCYISEFQKRLVSFLHPLWLVQ